MYISEDSRKRRYHSCLTVSIDVGGSDIILFDSSIFLVIFPMTLPSRLIAADHPSVKWRESQVSACIVHSED